MKEVYDKYIVNINAKVTKVTETLNELEASYKGFNNVYKSYIITPNIKLDNLIKTSTSAKACRDNKYKIQALMQEDDTNKELYIAAIRLANLTNNIDSVKYELTKLKKHYIEYEAFLVLYKQVNREVERRCLLGEVYYTGGIGIIQIELCAWDNKVDWNKTNELKQLLISKGVDLYDATTGKGTKYMIYHDDTLFPLWKWHRAMAGNTNFISYSFKPVLKIKTDDRKMSTIENSQPSIESILSNKDIGAGNKLILIAKVHPQMLSNYAN